MFYCSSNFSSKNFNTLNFGFIDSTLPYVVITK